MKPLCEYSRRSAFCVTAQPMAYELGGLPSIGEPAVPMVAPLAAVSTLPPTRAASQLQRSTMLLRIAPAPLGHAMLAYCGFGGSVGDASSPSGFGSSMKFVAFSPARKNKRLR